MSNIGKVIQVINASGCDHLMKGAQFTVRGEDETCYTIYNPKTRSVRRYAKHRFSVTPVTYHIKEQDPVVVTAHSTEVVYRVIGVSASGLLRLKHLFEPIGTGAAWVVPPGRVRLANAKPGTHVAFYYAEAFGKDKAFPRESTVDYYGRNYALPLPAYEDDEFVLPGKVDTAVYNAVNNRMNAAFYGPTKVLTSFKAVSPVEVVQAAQTALEQVQAVNGQYSLSGIPREVKFAVTCKDRVQTLSAVCRVPSVNGMNVALSFPDHAKAVEFARLFTQGADNNIPQDEAGWTAAIGKTFRFRGNDRVTGTVKLVAVIPEARSVHDKLIFVVLYGNRIGQVIMRGFDGKSADSAYDIHSI